MAWRGIRIKQACAGDATIVVQRGSTDAVSGASLIAAYAAAKLLTPGGAALSVNNQVDVAFPPGGYDVGATPLTLDTNYVNLVAMYPARGGELNEVGDKSYAPPPTRIYTSAAAASAVVQTARAVKLRGFSIEHLGASATDAYGFRVTVGASKSVTGEDLFAAFGSSGTTMKFRLRTQPITPSSLSLVVTLLDGTTVYTIADNGAGVLTGNVGAGTKTIDYDSGEIVVDLPTAPDGPSFESVVAAYTADPSNAESSYQEMYFWHADRVGYPTWFDTSEQGTWDDCIGSRLAFRMGGTTYPPAAPLVFGGTWNRVLAQSNSFVGDQAKTVTAQFRKCRAIGRDQIFAEGTSSGPCSFAGCGSVGSPIHSTCLIEDCDAGDNSYGLGVANAATIRRSRGGINCAAGMTADACPSSFLGVVEDSVFGAGSCGGYDSTQVNTPGTVGCRGKIRRTRIEGNNAPLRCEGATIEDSVITATTTGVDTIVLLDSNTKIVNSTILVLEAGVGTPVRGENLALATGHYAFTHADLTLTKANAFTSYSHAAGSKIYLSGGTNITPGWYEIASKTSNNAIVLAADPSTDHGDHADVHATKLDYPRNVVLCHSRMNNADVEATGIGQTVTNLIGTPVNVIDDDMSL